MRVVFRVVDADAGVWGCPMTAHLFPTLPADWHELFIELQPGTGCWMWRDPRPKSLSWRAARTLIATELGLTDVTDCGLSAYCVKPSHSAHTRLPAGGSA